MDQSARSLIREEEVLDVLNIVRQLTTRKREKKKQTPIERWFERAASTLLTHSIAILVALFCLVAMSWIFQKDALRDALYVTSVLLGGLELAIAFIGVGGAIPFFHRLRKAPFDPLLSSVSEASHLDLPSVNELVQHDREVVSFVLAHYAHERLAFKKRGGMLAGALEKVGLFPALAAFFGVAATVWDHTEFPFARALVFVIPAFYCMNFWALSLMQNMDRTIAMLEYSLQVIENKA
ncbi:hypothetical protein CBA19CS11_06445 [Caballeronia novacaledonica]|uniref:hypothetical protein n=1 Tax=Caballeronia novacaledonica TaxID=1544861 RepID=UPI001EE39668|nr:hypothetical protein [Caballeronia novacaledonica]GJH08449.1 hypothetical protein CBA19CS11_06445 [Caballeronia novacaledonica]